MTSANDGYDPNANAIVNALVVQPDGKTLIGGYFTALQPNNQGSAIGRNHLARLNHDGSIDTSFTASTDNVVRALFLQANGQILVGGTFANVTPTGGSPTPRNYVARLNADGTLDTTFNPNPNGVVYAMLQQPDGRVVIGGSFTTVQPNGASAPVTRNHIARFNTDGSLDTTFDPNTDKTVLSLAIQANLQIVVGGGFATLQPNGSESPTTRNCLARINSDGSLDTGFDPEPNGSVQTILVLGDQQVVVGGEFTTVQPNGQTSATQCDFLARLNSDGSVDANYIINPLNSVSALAVQTDGKLIIAGTFQQVYPQNNVASVASSYIARINTDGSIDTTFQPNPNQAVNAVAVEPDGDVTFGGYFTSVQPEDTIAPTLRNFIARSNYYGVPDSTVAPDSAGQVFATAVLPNGQFLVGGTFLSVGGVTQSFLARLNSDGSLDKTFGAKVNGPIQCIVLQPDSKILIGGSFSEVDGIQRGNIARLNPDGTLDGPFNPNVNSNVIAMAVASDGQIYIGGNFNVLEPNGSTAGFEITGLARLNTDGSADLTFNPAPNGSIFTIVIDSKGRILIGGGFTMIGNVTHSYAARLLPSGAIDSQVFDPEPNTPVYAIAVQTDNKVLLGGSFSAVAPQTAVPGTATTLYNYPNAPQTVLPAAGASATTAIYVNHIVRINTDGSFDSSFQPDPSADVLSIAIQSNNAIVVGGVLTSFAPDNQSTGIIRNYIGRLNSDGSIDPNFNPNANQLVSSVTLLSNQELLIGGAFTTVQPNGAASPTFATHVALLNTDGSLNTSFNSGSNTSNSGSVLAFAQQLNGPVVFAGTFSPLDGAPGSYLARLNGDASIDPTYNTGVNGPVYALSELPTGASTETPSNAAIWLNSNGQVRYSYSAASNGEVLCSTVDAQGRVLVGGLFSNFDDVSGVLNLVRINTDGTIDTTFTPAPNAVVNAIVVQPDGNIVIGGGFNEVGGTVEPYLARLNPTTGVVDTSYSPAPNLQVVCMLVEPDGSLIVGGDFTQMIPNAATTVSQINYLAHVKIDGTLDTNFNPDPNGPAYCLAFSPDKSQVYVGGYFTTMTPNLGSTVLNVQYLARLNTSTGAVDTSYYPAPNAAVTSMVVDPNNNVIAAGTFTNWTQNYNPTTITATSPPPPSVASAYLTRVKPDGSIDTTFAPNPNNGLSYVAIETSGSSYQLIVGGAFTAFQPSGAAIPFERSNLARINEDGSVDPAFDPSFNGDVDAVSVLADGSLFVGGNFTEVQVGGAILVGGAFTQINGSTQPNLARLNADGSLDSSYLANADGPVDAIATNETGTSIVGGSFQHVAGQPEATLARITPAGTLDLSFGAFTNGTVFALAYQPNGSIIVGGAFTSVNTTPTSNIVRLLTSGAIDTSFNASANGTVSAALVLPGGQVIIAGSFTSVDGQAMQGLARLNSDGTLDGTFNPAPNGPVNTVARSVDGTLYVGGSFTSIGGLTYAYVAHLNANGTVDPSYYPAPNGTVNTLAVQQTGKVYLGGSFTTVGGLSRTDIARTPALIPATQALSMTSDQRSITWSLGGSFPSFSAVHFEETTDGTHWTSLGSGTSTDGQNWTLSGIAPSGQPLVLIRGTGVVPSNQYASGGLVQTTYLENSQSAPVVDSLPTLNGTAGSPIVFTVTATQFPKTFQASGLPTGLSINPTTGVISGTPSSAGTYNVTLTISNGSASTVSALTITVGQPGQSTFVAAPTSSANRLLNISSRADLPGSNKLFAGFVVSGVGPKNVVIRAVGPGLAEFNVPGVMATPELQLYSSSGTLIDQNTAWNGGSALSAAFAQVGAFPLTAGTSDAALLETLQPGSYTIEAFDPNGKGGVVLAEVYDASPSPMTATQRLVNISARGVVSPGAGALIGGFVISGSSMKTVLIRGIGPGLSSFGVSGAIKDPVLSVYDQNNNLVAQNLSWTSQSVAGIYQAGVTPEDISTANGDVGAFDLSTSSADTALIATLPPGAYTFEVTSASNSTGAALGEVYEMP
ncbi:MAG TPA: putative Ig domain-containing protein [Opitutaceae bacterium]